MATEIIRERNAASGAWAAAAFVLAIGGLLFGFTAHVRANELEAQVAPLMAQRQGAAGAPVGTGTGGDGVSGGDASSPGASTGAPSSGPTADEGAARIAVTRAFSTLYDGSRPMADRAAVVDQPDGIGEALTAAEAGPSGALVKQVVVSVNDVRFETPQAAKVTYSLTVPNSAPFTGRSGSAVFIDGAWKVSRTTICGDLVAIGAGC